MRFCLFLLVPLLAFAGTTQVEIRESEVWVIGDGEERRITHDGRPKDPPVLSPSRERIAYVEQCNGRQECTPTIYVLDLQGRRVRTYQPKRDAAPCASVLSIAWTGGDTIAAVCHINPSLSAYIEAEISTGRNKRELLGYDFTPSPDGKWVAHVGWIVHFAPPYAQSNYLQIDHTTIYPLPEGMSPVKQTGLTEPPQVVRRQGPTYRGIHEFRSGLYWSPDSQRIALIDCTYDWTPRSPSSLSRAGGKESGRRCSLAVVSTDGQSVLFPLADEPPEDLYQARLSWTGARQLSLDINGKTRMFSLP